MAAPAEPTRICVTTPDGGLDLLKLLAMLLQKFHSSLLFKLVKTACYLHAFRLAFLAFSRAYREILHCCAEMAAAKKKAAQDRKASPFTEKCGSSDIYDEVVEMREARGGVRQLAACKDFWSNWRSSSSLPLSLIFLEIVNLRPIMACTTEDGLELLLQEFLNSFIFKLLKIIVCIHLLRLAFLSLDSLYGDVADTIAAYRALRKAKREEARSQRTQYEKRPPV